MNGLQLILNVVIGVNKFALTEPDNLDSYFEANMRLNFV